jgi:type I restriction enzyme S subunit
VNVQIPPGWRWASPDELSASERHALGIGPFGSDLKVSDYTDHGVPLVFVRNIRAEAFLPTGQPHVSTEKAALLAAHRVRPGDVLITKMGEPPGDAAVYPEHGPEGRMTADCIRLRVDRTVATPKFVMYATRAPVVRQQIIEATRGVAQKKISLERFRTVRYPLPPIGLQRRIVDLIDTHFSRLDAAVASLTRAKANLKRARASVLKAAVEGRLVPTEAALARAEGRDYEPASVLLARILAERKASWAASEARGKYADPVKPETEGSPGLPEGWCWASVDSLLAEPLRNGKSAKTSDDGTGVRTLTLTAVTVGRFTEDNTKFSVATTEEVDGLWLEPGDLLVQRSNTPDLVGTTALYNGPRNWAVYPDLLIRVRATYRVAVAWLASVFHSPPIRRYFRERAQGISGSMPKISQDTIQAAIVPLPPLTEQHRIVAEVDRRLSVLDALDATVDANLARCARLRQSILKCAFEGRLVPAEAPASDLLLAAEPQPAAYGSRA